MVVYMLIVEEVMEEATRAEIHIEPASEACRQAQKPHSASLQR